jgi:plastocyanin
MKAKIASNALRNGVLIAMALLVTIVGIIISTAALASAQGSNTVQIFSYTFSNPGTFEYYCTVHPSMVAEIVVS